MPANIVHGPAEEKLWQKAKAIAAKEGHKEDWAYINGIFQKGKKVKQAGIERGIPDATGPHGRGAGPGQGTRSGLGLIQQKLDNGETLTPEEQAIYDQYNMSKNSGVERGVPDATGPYGRGLGPGQGTASGMGLLSQLKAVGNPEHSGGDFSMDMSGLPGALKGLKKEDILELIRRIFMGDTKEAAFNKESFIIPTIVIKKMLRKHPEWSKNKKIMRSLLALLGISTAGTVAVNAGAFGLEALSGDGVRGPGVQTSPGFSEMRSWSSDKPDFDTNYDIKGASLRVTMNSMLLDATPAENHENEKVAGMLDSIARKGPTSLRPLLQKLIIMFKYPEYHAQLNQADIFRKTLGSKRTNIIKDLLKNNKDLYKRMLDTEGRLYSGKSLDNLLMKEREIPSLAQMLREGEGLMP